MLAYVNEDYYIKEYRSGSEPVVDSSDFRFYAMKATKEIRARTFGNINEDHNLPEEVKACTCEIMETLCLADKAKGENGLILQSFSNDGDSGSYMVESVTVQSVAEQIDYIVRSWLLDTGLMFCGRKRK